MWNHPPSFGFNQLQCLRQQWVISNQAPFLEGSHLFSGCLFDRQGLTWNSLGRPGWPQNSRVLGLNVCVKHIHHNFQESVLSFHHAGSQDQTQVISLCNTHLVISMTPFLFWDGVLIYSFGWSRTHNTDQDDLKHPAIILLAQVFRL